MEESEAECGSADLGPLLIWIPVGLSFSDQMGLWKLQALGEFLLSWGGLGALPEGLFLSGTLPSALVYPGTGRGWFHLKSGSLKTGPGTRCFLRNT